MNRSTLLGQPLDHLTMLRIVRKQFAAISHLEVIELESRSDGAAEEREAIGIIDERAEPASCRDHDLEMLVMFEVRSKLMLYEFAACFNRIDRHRIADMKVPDLI